MIHWFRHLSRMRQIGVCTIAAHLLLLFSLTVQHLLPSSVKKPRPIAVNTIRIVPAAPKITSPISSAAKQTALPSAPLKASQAPTAKAVKPKETKKVPLSKVEKKVVATPKQTALLKEIEHNLAEIAPTSVTQKTTKKVALKVPELKAAAPVLQVPTHSIPSAEESEASPSQRISAFLQESLHLPEIGPVRVQITIDRFGKLLTVEILDSKSKKNAEFLKNQLPDLQFPCLNETVSLTIVFSNEL